MSTVKIEELENIVLEGGGAKGAAYAGAIDGLEKALRWKLGSDAVNPESNGVAILDYGKMEGNVFTPQVKRFAGSSAGAITSMALSLGFSKQEIEAISEFEFSTFLMDKHDGKYRMIDRNGELKIGEDRRSLLGMGNGKADYKFNFHSPQAIKESWLKAQIHSLILGQIRDLLVTGLVEKLPNLKAIWNKLTQGGNGNFDLDDYISEPGIVELNLKTTFNLAFHGPSMLPMSPTSIVEFPAGTPNSPAFKSMAKRLINDAIDLWFWKLSKDQGMNLKYDSLGNLIWDRGLFSGFAIREFFYDMMLYACVNNTHFQRSYFKEPADRAALKDVKMTMAAGRTKADFSKLSAGIQQKLLDLPTMTFAKFKEITGISVTFCVSNFSTNEPNYYSDYWTPDFPILEAVGASMTIPPAIRPVYNEGNVYRDTLAVSDLYAINGKTLEHKAAVAGKSEYFDFDAYNLDAVAIKKFLSGHFGVAIDINSPMSVSGHLTHLRRMLQELEDSPGYVAKVLVNNELRVLTRSKFIYHYNAAFKGLMMDGGYLNNIPYNVFRTSMADENCTDTQIDPHLNKTFAIKLDDNFPKEWVSHVYAVLSKANEKLGTPKMLMREQRKVLGKVLHGNFRAMLTRNNKKAQERLMDEKDIKDLNPASFERVAAAVVAQFNALSSKNSKPWNKKKAIIATAFEGYEYGTGSGQVRSLSDHDHILPLYSYGVGTFDFDLKKIAPLVALSKRKSKERVEDYFGVPESER